VTAVVTNVMSAATMTAMAVHECRARHAQVAQPDATELRVVLMVSTTFHCLSPYSVDCFTMWKMSATVVSAPIPKTTYLIASAVCCTLRDVSSMCWLPEIIDA